MSVGCAHTVIRRVYAHFLNRIVRKRKRPKAFGNFHAAALDATGPADRSSVARVTVGSVVRPAHICAGTRAHLRCRSAQVRQSRQGLGMGPTPSRMRPTSPAVAHKVPVHRWPSPGEDTFVPRSAALKRKQHAIANVIKTRGPRRKCRFGRGRTCTRRSVGGQYALARLQRCNAEAELRRIGATCKAAKGAEARPRRTLPGSLTRSARRCTRAANAVGIPSGMASACLSSRPDLLGLSPAERPTWLRTCSPAAIGGQARTHHPPCCLTVRRPAKPRSSTWRPTHRRRLRGQNCLHPGGVSRMGGCTGAGQRAGSERCIVVRLRPS